MGIFTEIEGIKKKYFKQGFEMGVEMQSEIMYSEEDMIEYSDYVLMCSAEKTFKLPLQPKEWFKKLKNK